MKPLVILAGGLILASCATAPPRSVDVDAELKYAGILLAWGMPDCAYTVLARVHDLPDPLTSPATQLPLTTPETFDTGRLLLNYMVYDHGLNEAQAYVKRHMDSDPVVYWAFQTYLHESWYDGRHEERLLHTYDQFMKAYEDRYLK